MNSAKREQHETTTTLPALEDVTRIFLVARRNWKGSLVVNVGNVKPAMVKLKWPLVSPEDVV